MNEKITGSNPASHPRGGKSFMSVVKLTKQLISIPSYVDKQTDEKKIGEFIYGYLKQFKWLKVIKQPVINGRFNVIVKDKYPTRLILCGHMDTVQPREGWKTNQFKGMVKNGKIYGLGASDMKGSLAAMLTSLNGIQKTKGLMLLFYIDEEYDFLGTKKFLEEYQNKIKPKLIISGDDGNLKIGRGCRGLIEIKFIVQGQTGHAAKPQSGKNAILATFAFVRNLEKYLAKFKNSKLGKTTLNLAFMRGGLNLGRDSNEDLLLGKEGNNIPDIAEFVLDIRPASINLDATKIIKKTKNIAKKLGVEILNIKVRHDLGSWLTKQKDLKPVISVIIKNLSIKYANPQDKGYIDIQMFWKVFNKTPCLIFGAGEESLAHKTNEFVRISELKKAEKIFKEIIVRLGE